MEEVTASLGEFLTELLKGSRCTAKITNDQIRVGIEGERSLLELKHLLWRDTLEYKNERAY